MPLALQASWLETLIKLHVDLEQVDDAERLLQSTGAAEKLTPLFRNTFLAAVAHRRGDTDRALTLARDTLANAPADAEVDELRDLAMILAQMDDTASALAALKRIVDSTATFGEIGRIVSLAWKHRDEDFILSLGESLRKAGRFHIGMLEAEVSVLRESSPARLEAFLRRVLQELPEGRESRHLRMRLTHLGVDLNRPELIERDASRLPHIDEIEEHQFVSTVDAIRHTSEPLHALEFAYQLVRKFPNAVGAHAAMIAAMGLGDEAHRAEIPAVDVAGTGTAVLLEDPISSEEKWYVIEEAQPSQPTLNEVAPDSAIAEAVRGHRVGDDVYVDEAFGTRRKLVIRKVVNKLRHRFDDCLQNLPRRFPDQQFVKAFHVKEDAPPGEAFAEVMQLFERTERREQDALAMYRQHPFPLHMLAHMAGGSMARAISLLLHDKESSLRCCRGDEAEGIDAITAVSNASVLVLETSTLLTWFFLYEAFGVAVWDRVAAWNVKRLVAEKTMEDLREFHEGLMSGRDRMGGRRQGHEMLPSVTSGDVLRHSGERLTRLMEFLTSHCEVQPGRSLNPFPAHRRELLLKAYGRAALESIIVAGALDALVWTDDLAVAELARETFQSKITWTQLTCRHLGPTELSNRVTWGLLAFRYEFASLSGNDAVAAAEEAKWDIKAHPLREVLDYFARPTPRDLGLIPIALTLLQRVWTHPVLGLQAHDVTLRLLDRLGKRDDGRKIIRAINSHVEALFGMNVVASRQLRKVIESWLSTTRYDGIIIP